MAELNFIGKSRGHGNANNMDVTVTFSPRTGKGTTVYFTFRNGMNYKLAPTTNAIEYAVDGTRLYFRETSPNRGYILAKNKDNKVNNRYASMSGDNHKELFQWAAVHQGDYEMTFDARLGLWCIEGDLKFQGKR